MDSIFLDKHNMKHPAETLGNTSEKTFQNQDRLPSLPLPTLKETLQKYLQSVKPLLTNKEYEKTESVIKQTQNDQLVSKLQFYLQQKSEQERNWVEKWWEDYAYLETRTPIAPLINFAGPSPYLDIGWTPKFGSQIQRTAFIMWCCADYWQKLRREEIPPQYQGKSKSSLCLNQFHRMFSTCQIPKRNRDVLHFHFKTESAGWAPNHMVVFCRGRLFKVIITDSREEILTVPELQSHLQFIRDYCDQRPEAPGLSAMTCADRNDWAEIYSHLIQLNEKNNEYLQDIETAIMCLSLEDSSPEGYNDICNKGLCGDCTVRWYDKSLTYSVYKNGVSSCNCCHSPHDAMIMVYLFNYVYSMIYLNSGEWKGSLKVRKFPTPKELEFTLDTKVLKAIEDAKVLYKQNCEKLHIEIQFYSAFGKDWILSKNFHPDCFIQVAIQAAYYSIYEKMAPTYETATVRTFYHGRTETVRSCTQEALEFSRSYLSSTSSVDEKKSLFIRAHKKQKDLMLEGMQCKGVDRHLFGLYIASLEQGLPLPDIFTDPAYVKSGGGGNYILSTSFVGYTPVFGGVAAMCKDGYGVMYSIPSKEVRFWITTWTADKNTDTGMMYASLFKTLSDLRTLFDGSSHM